jgi:hypothetical protein
MIVDKYGNYVRKFMWQLCGWGRVDIHNHFESPNIIALLDNFQNCALMNCQRNVNSLLPPELSYTFSYSREQ